MLRATGDDDEIHEHPGHAHSLRVRDAFHDSLDLRDDDAAVVARGLRDGEHLADERLAFEREVAARVGGRGADEADGDGEGAVTQPVLTVE